MPSASNNAESSAIDGGSPRVSRRTAFATATAAGASALGMLTTGVASAADPRARCAAPQFLKPFEIAGKWTVPLPIPTELPTGTAAPGFNASPTELSNWQGQYPAYVMQPRGWIRVADIQQQLQQPVYRPGKRHAESCEFLVRDCPGQRQRQHHHLHWRYGPGSPGQAHGRHGQPGGTVLGAGDQAAERAGVLHQRLPDQLCQQRPVAAGAEHAGGQADGGDAERGAQGGQRLAVRAGLRQGHA